MPNTLLPYLALVPYAAIAVGLAATLVLFFSLKIEVRRNSRRERRRVDELLERLREAAPATAPETVFVPATGRAGLNINRRTHILRLLRKGEDAAHISAALGVPQNEVELLMRVQEMVNPRTEPVRQAAAAANAD
jgi:hypothetical protein